jgi:DegV family protein with EDD domain
VFDSKSASAGQLLIAVKIRELLKNKLPKDQIIENVNNFIDNMKTYFVLENHDNLLKNGRLHKVTSKLVNILNIKLVMGSDPDGNIALYAKPRGTRRMVEELLSLVHKSNRASEDNDVVICHCNNLSLAQQLREAIRSRFNFREIYVLHTRGLSTLYADNKGIIMAF